MSWVALVGAMLVFAGGQSAAAGEPLPPAESYVGSEACGDCHRARYDGWKETYHASVVRDVRKDPAAVLGGEMPSRAARVGATSTVAMRR